MRLIEWTYMLVGLAAAVLFFGIEPRIGFYIAFVMLAINFATFCIMYDDPVKRARDRTQQLLLQISSRGVHAEEYQRLQSRKVVATTEDRRFRLSPLSGLNVASGIACALILVWAIIARIV